jgi:hypothetical protein
MEKVRKRKKEGSQTDRKRIKKDKNMSDKQIVGQTDRENNLDRRLEGYTGK